MGFPQAPSPPHQYSEAIQLKLYQAFIFSIPILFAIILILLFYLFYLKRRASGTSAYPPVLPRTINDVNITAPSPGSDMKDVKIKLCAVLFDEYMKRQDTQVIGAVCAWESMRRKRRWCRCHHASTFSTWIASTTGSRTTQLAHFVEPPLSLPTPPSHPTTTTTTTTSHQRLLLHQILCLKRKTTTAAASATTLMTFSYSSSIVRGDPKDNHQTTADVEATLLWHIYLYLYI
ncbi:RING-H2 finger protein ATL7 isoform X1 [Andrographis paniculata]|uniref:RING-H2 finger protein ATL7 isoform X1 n=1 Tax=Andrographis paniculata TaxID=175694 RepID=UPI0021E79503|nr:RING-H2 finger protein ATL7 isoform X1 [Andrographis paniculata]XP_051129711.1 RING-H2 finger protein ATL7 isoform X1 [Andrographis paniculata]